jgi:hypothetical protein
MNKASRRFLSEDQIYRDLTIVLALVLVASVFLEPVLKQSRIESYLAVVFLIFALYQITRRASDVVIGLALGIPSVAGWVVDAATQDTPAANIGPVILSTLFLGFLTWHILRDVFSGSRISSEQIFGAVCAYLLIGFLFSNIYGFVALVNDQAFTVSDALRTEIEAGNSTRGSGVFIYFSFVTMTTLGYGDMSPASSAARSFAWIQAVLGQLYVAITIAALVGSHVSRRQQ